MIWIKLGILIIGFIYSGVLPFTVKRTLRQINFNLKEQTLSFLSNKSLYGKRFTRGYKRLLFITALLHFAFFWLLSKYYDLGDNETYMQYTTYSFALLTLLAFVPHNIHPYSFKKLSTTIQRLLHNLLGVVVFLTLPTLIIVFQAAIMESQLFLGISGLVIISCTVLVTIGSLIKTGISGITEILFINGISIWSIFTSLLTMVL
ncbi:MAG: hypothetical protein WC396_06090 [Bacteroidales bacterium]|jgi:hypothetical protein|nr:hypothetical protein [Bacteroidales bacterium]MDD4256423.1 hypothetical protein [Bacteroidales bacterium]MDD4654666.1 hypothetical protein [Bacteroidales bacterium]